MNINLRVFFTRKQYNKYLFKDNDDAKDSQHHMLPRKRMHDAAMATG